MKTLPALVLLAILTVPPLAVCSPPPYTPQPIHARFNIRYRCPLGKASRAAIHKDSIGTTDRYDLPESKVVVKGTSAERTIQGGVEGLPFEFYLRLTRTSDTDPGLLEINAVDQRTKQTLPGFPKKIPQARKEFAENDGQITVDLQLTKAENAVLLRWLTAFVKSVGSPSEGPITFDPPFLLIGSEDTR